MDELQPAFVADGQPSDLSFVIAEFPTATQALTALEDLARWSRDRSGVSFWRLQAEDGTGRVVAACTFTMTGYKDTLVRRMRRKGGTLANLPDDVKIQLANRMLEQAASGSSGANWGIDERLDEPPRDGQRTIELP